MNYIYDIAAVLFIALMIGSGYKRGFVKIMLGIVSVIIAFFLASAISEPAANFAYDSYIEPEIESQIDTRLAGLTSGHELVSTGKQNFTAFEQDVQPIIDYISSISHFIGSLPWSKGVQMLPEKIRNSIFTDMQQNKRTLQKTLLQTVIRPAVIPPLRSLCFLLIFTLVSTALRILSRQLSFINRLPLIGVANSLLGGVLGLIKGVIYLILICLLLRFIFYFTENKVSGLNEEVINKTSVFSQFYNLKLVNPYESLHLFDDSLLYGADTGEFFNSKFNSF